MNKAEIVMELSALRADVDFDYSIPKPAKKAIVNRIGEIIIDLLLLDDDKPNCSHCYQEKEIQRLQMFLMKNFQGQLDGTKGAVENAIRLLKRGEISEDKTA